MCDMCQEGFSFDGLHDIPGKITYLCIRHKPTPSSTKEWYFGKPINNALAIEYYNNPGFLVGEIIKITPTELHLFEKFLDMDNFLDTREYDNFEAVVNLLKEGNTMDMWLEKKDIYVYEKNGKRSNEKR
jgi:hypothetical protein